MPSIDEHEHHFQKVISRWENEGGAVSKSERSRPKAVANQKALQSRRHLGCLSEPMSHAVSAM